VKLVSCVVQLFGVKERYFDVCVFFIGDRLKYCLLSYEICESLSLTVLFMYMVLTSHTFIQAVGLYFKVSIV